MSRNLFCVCNVIAESQEDYQFLVEHLSKYPVNVFSKYNTENLCDYPTILVGWSYVKERFPNLNIFDKQIEENLFWTYSHSEDEKLFISEVEEFFYNSLKKWLPKDFIHFDSLSNKDGFLTFCKNEIKKDSPTFTYFNNGALYLRNEGKNFIINIKSLSLTEPRFRDIVTEFLNSYKIIAFSYKNFCEYINLDTIQDVWTIENLRWVGLGANTSEKYFNIIPNFDTHRYIPFFMSKLNSISLSSEETVFLKRMCKRDLATFWMSTREIALKEDVNIGHIDFKSRKNYKLAKIEYSNKRTITGRVVAHDQYNPQNLQKGNEERADIITRFNGGNILVYDYTSFETRISLFKCDNKEYLEKYKNTDLHYESSKILYERNEITDEERNFCKILNHAILYGAGEDTLLKKLSIFSEPGYKLYMLRQFLAPLIKMANEMREQFSNKGYLINDWGSIIRIDKTYASFNNFIQSTAAEIVLDKVWEIRELFKGKMSQFLFQVHDSLVFDIHPSEEFLINQIGTVLSNHNGMKFSLVYATGKDYKHLEKNIVFSD